MEILFCAPHFLLYLATIPGMRTKAGYAGSSKKINSARILKKRACDSRGGGRNDACVDPDGHIRE
jgi:hypothetical protein